MNSAYILYYARCVSFRCNYNTLTTWTNEMNFVMNHAPVAGPIASPVASSQARYH